MNIYQQFWVILKEGILLYTNIDEMDYNMQFRLLKFNQAQLYNLFSFQMRNIHKAIFRLSTRAKQSIELNVQQIALDPEYKNNSNNKSDKKQPTYIFEIDQIQDKIIKAKNILYSDLAQRFEGKPLVKSQTIVTKIPQITKTKQQQATLTVMSEEPYKFNKKIYIDVPKINLLMNANTSIEFDPQQIKYEYQQSVQTLAQNIFSHETEKNLRKKEKSLTKSLLNGCKLQKDLIENLLMLYGLRRQQQFQENLIDPLQKILSSNRPTQRALLKHLADMINRMNTRTHYYEQILIYLPLQQLVKFTSTASLIKKIDIVSWIVKYKALMQISGFILQNKEVQRALESFTSSNNASKSEKQINVKHIFEIELWILKILQNFLASFQTEQFKKEAIILVCQNLSIYQKIKHKLQNLIKIKNMNKSIYQNSQYLNESTSKQLARLEQLLEHKQQEQIYEKVSQIILFLDIKQQNKNQQIQIYHSIFKILLEFSDIKIADHIFQKVIDDHIKIFINQTQLEKVNENYIKIFTEFVVRNLEVQISNEYVYPLFKLICLLNIQKYKNIEEMTFDQGKYFVIALHIVAAYFKKLKKIEKEAINYKALIQTLRKYGAMIQKNQRQFESLNKKVILESLEKALAQLFSTNPQKNTVSNMLKKIKITAQNDKS